jgi:dihydrodipicolinate synthase/N-acetylneuraminate lyase
MPHYPLPPVWVLDALRRGLAIPAHPLALTPARKLDERRQRALTRYYAAAGAGGVAVGVHTTQFAIRDAGIDLLQPVLALAAETLAEREARGDGRLVRIAGVCGQTRQAVGEAEMARGLGYHAGLLSLAALREADDNALIDHARAVAEALPLVGFYLQPAVGGRVLGLPFWRRFAEIPNVVAIKIAPFNRYQTLDVVRAVAEAGRAGEIALYTGNDDAIGLDLLTSWNVSLPEASQKLRIAGGLLGHWACWTRRAVEFLAECQAARQGEAIPARLLTKAAQITDCNAAFFDAAHQFAGCIPGIHEVLRRQGLLANTLCLDPREELSPGQADEIERVYRAYPELNDDEFVREHRDEWLGYAL